MSFFKILILTIWCIPYQLLAQNQVTIVQGDSLDIPCNPSCTTLTSAHPIVKLSNVYSISTIPFAPIITAGNTITFIGDDYFSDTIAIGFPFCFYNNVYQKLCISDNGQVTFNQTYKNAPSSFDTQMPLPFFNSAFPDNAIFGPFIDAKLSSGGSVKYATIGTSPNKKFVITYNGVAYFNNGCTNAANNNFQIILYETTNIIECHITNKEVCNTIGTNWLNYSTLGIQSITATSFYAASGKNASIWTSNNEAYQFAPDGPIAFTMSWKKLGGLAFSNLDSVVYCPSSKNEKVIFTFQTFCPNIIYEDTIIATQYKPIIDSISIIKPPCPNNATGCLTFYANSINLPLQYSINNNSFQPNAQICNLNSGVYYISIKDALGCISNTIINLQPISQIIIVPDLIKPDSCPMNNGTIAIHATGGTAPYTYQWSNGSTDSIITGLAGNVIYNVIVMDANGCTSTADMYINLLGNPSFTNSVTKPTCNFPNGSIQIFPNGPIGPYTYLWNTGDITNTLTNIPNGTYSVTITANNGCTRNAIFVLVDSLQVQLNVLASNTTCGFNNGSIIATANNGTPAYNFYINNILQTTFPITALASGPYTVKVVDAIGCTKTTIVNIATSTVRIIAFNIAPPNCDSINGTLGVTITNFIGNVSYLWSNGATTNIITNLDTGTYFITITDSVSCSKTDTIVVNRTPNPHLKIVNYTSPSCFGDSNGSVLLTVIGGTPSYKYSTDNINFSAIAQLNNISGGTYIIYCKDASGCKRDSIITFYQPDSMYVITSGLHPLICFADKIDSIHLQAFGGNPPYQYKLDSNNFSSENNFYDIENKKYTITIKDNNNCTLLQDIKIDAPPSPLLATVSKQDIPCFAINKGQLAVTAEGGWGNYIYTWNNGDITNQLMDVSVGVYTVSIADEK